MICNFWRSSIWLSGFKSKFLHSCLKICYHNSNSYWIFNKKLIIIIHDCFSVQHILFSLQISFNVLTIFDDTCAKLQESDVVSERIRSVVLRMENDFRDFYILRRTGADRLVGGAVRIRAQAVFADSNGCPEQKSDKITNLKKKIRLNYNFELRLKQ